MNNATLNIEQYTMKDLYDVFDMSTTDTYTREYVTKKYNTLVYLPFNHRYEKLFKKENTYDIILVLNYNMKPIKKNKGSAIFIHVAKKNYKKTKGCIATGKTQLLKIIKKIKNDTKVKIVRQK